MTEQDYMQLQEWFTKKMGNQKREMNNREAAYVEGILACKSILKDYCRRYYKNELWVQHRWGETNG